jgi:3-oxoacyl-[acyl-carrier-protein] synthase II
LRLLRCGAIDAAICGGSEACVLPITIAGFTQMGALSKRATPPESASRPFEAARDGMVIAEGAATLVLEREDTARRRDAPMLAEVMGYGASVDTFHATQPAPDGRGAISSMREALLAARLNADEIDYINAHGTGTRANDLAETLAIKSLFGQHAYTVPVSSTKSMTGHMLGAAGAFEAVVAIQSIHHSMIAPTINLDVADPACDLDFVPHHARERRVRRALSNSFGFGGQNASLVFGALY